MLVMGAPHDMVRHEAWMLVYGYAGDRWPAGLVVLQGSAAPHPRSVPGPPPRTTRLLRPLDGRRKGGVGFLRLLLFLGYPWGA